MCGFLKCARGMYSKWHRKWPVRITSAESKTFKNKFCVWSEYITEHLSGLYVKLLGTENLLTSLR